MINYKKILAIIFFLNSCQFIYSQDKQKDSLDKILHTRTDGSVKAEVLIKLSGLYWDTHPDSALHFGILARNISRENKLKELEARSLLKIGNAHWSLQNFYQAQEFFHEALNISEVLKNPELQAYSYTNIGLIYTEMGDYKEAISNLLNALQFFEKATTEIEKKEKDDQKKTARLLKIKINKTYALIDIADALEKAGSLDAALVYYNRANSLAYQMDDIDFKGVVLLNLAGIYFKKNMPDDALGYYRESLVYLVELGNTQYLASANLGIAEVFTKKAFEGIGNSGLIDQYIDTAIFYAKAALMYGREENSKEEMYGADTILSTLFERQKVTDSAFHYSKLALTIKDSLQMEHQQVEVERLKFRQKEFEKKRSEMRVARNNNFQILFVGIGIAVLFGLLLILSKRKTKYKYLNYFGLLTLLILFEYINIVAHPFINNFTDHQVIYFLIVSVTIAALLSPFHHRLSEWVHNNFEKKRRGRPRKNSSTLVSRSAGIKKKGGVNLDKPINQNDKSQTG
jgi:tetratricopeptide (TPR) repeat protein